MNALVLLTFQSGSVAQSINASFVPMAMWLATIGTGWFLVANHLTSGDRPAASIMNTRIIMVIIAAAVISRLVSGVYAHTAYEPMRRTAFLATEIILNPASRGRVDSPGFNPITSQGAKAFGTYALLLVGSWLSTGITLFGFIGSLSSLPKKTGNETVSGIHKEHER